ncbi:MULTISPECIES: YgaC family protein [Microbacterium]|uniref:YgaC family protein n=1 Tax=Microbacterium TaxID=33882 RepID=UPI00214C4464|nr:MULTISPECIES: YgaC family protein [unclassified Microbacterium]MCR2812556.1 YgaC family protein [Microbacterium sp. zg.Y1084]MDL5485714.1 YgaC family protein [Microbacterium sp. zg-Y1211]
MTVAPEPPRRPAPGTRLSFRWRKWDGGVHWVHECVYLGSDRWGDWVGQRPGDRSVRPGRDVIAEHPNVSLIPPDGDWVLTMNAPPHRTRIYIDLAWDAGWQDGEPVGIDMDLDVVDHVGTGVYVDDRDEWEEHRVAYGYPLDVVERLEDVAVTLEARVRAHEAPFDDATAAHWFTRLAALAADARAASGAAADADDPDAAP